MYEKEKYVMIKKQFANLFGVLMPGKIKTESVHSCQQKPTPSMNALRYSSHPNQVYRPKQP